MDDPLGLFGTPTPATAPKTRTPSSKPRPAPLALSPALGHLREDVGLLTPTSAAYRAHRSGKEPQTPRGQAFRRIGQLFAEGKITTDVKGKLKDAVISGQSINTKLDELLAVPKENRDTINRIVTEATKDSPENPFDIFDFATPAKSPAVSRTAKTLDRADSFSNLRAPSSGSSGLFAAASTAATSSTAAGTAAADDDWWADSTPATATGTGTATATAASTSAKPQPPPVPPKPKSKLSKQARSATAVTRRKGSVDSSGSGAGAGAGAGAAIPQSRSRRGSDASLDDPGLEKRLEGELYVREGHLVLKKWKPRWVVMDSGRIFVYGSRAEYSGNRPFLFSLTLRHDMGLSDMKVADKKSRIFYRHVFEMKPGAVLASGDKGKHRVWKWGAQSMSEFERWTKAMRGHINQLAKNYRKREKDSLALKSAVAATDLLHQAVDSPRRRPRRRSSVDFGSRGAEVSADEATTVSVYLLDRSVHRLTVHRGGTLKDLLLMLRQRLKLVADADFALFLRDTAGGVDQFTCLPDDMKVEEADAQSLLDTRSLVYKRRIVLPTPDSGSDGAHAAHAEDVLDIATEEAQATSVDSAAHKLAYIEAVYNVTTGNYLLSLDDALQLAALQLVTDLGLYTPDAYAVSALEHNMPSFLSAEALLEATVGMGMKVADVMGKIADKAKALTSMSAFEAQRLYLRTVKDLPEYGATFFTAELVRYVAGKLEGADTPDVVLPDWLLECTGDDRKRPPPSAPVLVAVNATGVFSRLTPPNHTEAVDIVRSTARSGGAHGRRGSDAGAGKQYATPCDWIQHDVQFVEVWGVKKTRPVFTYRVREVGHLILVELQSTQYQAMASTLHMYVFNLLAQREGKTHAPSRAGIADYGVHARRAKAAADEAKRLAKQELPSGWTEIRDPVTGNTAYWNQYTKKTVFARPEE